MLSHQREIMTEARSQLQKKTTSPEKSEDRLAKALRQNLHRRKVQARLRAAAAVRDAPVTSSDSDPKKSLAVDSTNG